jgi:anti-sigma factor RsiW
MSIAVPLECDKVLLVQAELDGELDAAEAAALAAHRSACPICQVATEELAQARALIATAPREPMPNDLRHRIMTDLANAALPHDAIPTFRDLWRWVASFGLGAACAAAILLLVLSPRETSLTEMVVDGHIRAMQPGHLEDVASSDTHTVKPWFDGRIDFTPPVKDLAAQQFPLRGGRLDYFAGRPVAALVYQRNKHVINLFIMRDEAGAASPETAQARGYNVVHWQQNGMAFWAVSDVEASQLRDFAEQFRRSP